jgi:alkylated DNA repair dioxygenase AlkB
MMETFVQRKRRKLSPDAPPKSSDEEEEEQSTDFKLAILASLHADKSQDILLDYLLSYDGSVEEASKALSAPARDESPRKRFAVTGYQSSLSSFAKPDTSNGASPAPKQLTKKGKTLHLYSPEDIEQHTPCSIIHNFLPQDQADALLKELLDEVPTFRKDTFQLFDRTVESPHTMRFYVDSWSELQSQKTEYVYNGSYVPDVAQTTSEMLKVSSFVQEAVNEEIQRRIRDFYPEGKKLKFQSPDPWVPNASFVNCYDGGKESVGYHSDQLTYLGPRAVIGSLSLGVAREFRVRRIVPPVVKTPSTMNNPNKSSASGIPTAQPKQQQQQADEQGQISIHLPHNSLLIMHAEMQEEWKHAVSPTPTITPHPLSGNKRINVTYRCYKEYLHPKYTPRCKCGTPAVLRCVQRRAATRGRYMWMCHAGYTPGQQGCKYFEWAEFDGDGRPGWAEGYTGNANIAAVGPVEGD